MRRGRYWLGASASGAGDHLVAGYTFELGKCYEEAVKLRQLESLALIDSDLCERVASGLGLLAPQGLRTTPPQRRSSSAPPCLSWAVVGQWRGGSWGS